MKLEEAMKKATPNDLRVYRYNDAGVERLELRRNGSNITYARCFLAAGHELGVGRPLPTEQSLVDAALLKHWHNVGPKLRDAFKLWNECEETHDVMCRCGIEAMYAAVELAEEVEGI